MTYERALLVVTCDQWVLSDGLLGSHNHTDTSQGQWGINCETFKIRNETKVSVSCRIYEREACGPDAGPAGLDDNLNRIRATRHSDNLPALALQNLVCQETIYSSNSVPIYNKSYDLC